MATGVRKIQNPNIAMVQQIDVCNKNLSITL
jgi:hypothetical protein